MSFVAAVKSVLSNYVGFTGRARRSEYWWFVLFTVLLGIVASILDNALGLNFVEGSSNGVIGLIVSLGLLLPGLAVAVRRLHDTDRAGWWVLIGLVPIVGAIVLIVFFVQDGTPGANRFGPSPKS
ncbi:DUF805 domain-containing protein [Micromonospora parathelypteridis]|uniref:Uncharacterized membrane protein YhaH (DUF805 family) n=1 Tax=Micromonospora parathelypteridis TaxID=1839617 RepID=A0A840VNA1_9ACTN|nr:DUF805 domain-containing protein [Micromonospora parathelypteridis]MBB5477426.1 uncharacterized membrane protein YhaH (DUF805 family) [Micromonospora parathelypteridis]GGO09838.1 DUF805 domain-containing protein [Micromonospora parathelypteridis]